MKNPGILHLITLITVLSQSGVHCAEDARQLEWDALMPPGYLESLQTPESAIDGAMGAAKDAFSFEDDSMEAQEAFANLQTLYRSAPLVEELNGERIRLAGFIVPLEFDFDEGTFSEFLLVPYFGACIHVPPPPSNQIVYVKTSETLNEEWLDYAVWATGTLSTESVDSEYGFAGYSMNDVTLVIYEEGDE